ncbi:MAG: hypothetical protein AABZ94_09145 [Candidatus Eisenbacteria bacterium]
MSARRTLTIAATVLVMGGLVQPPLAAAQSNNGVYGGYVASSDWFRSMRQGAANIAMLRSLAHGGAATSPGQIPADYVEVAGKIGFAGGANPFPGGRLPDLRITATEPQRDEVERAPFVAKDGTFYTVLRRGVSYDVSWMYYFGGRESWNRIDVAPDGPRQRSVELIFGAPGSVAPAPASGPASPAPDSTTPTAAAGSVGVPPPPAIPSDGAPAEERLSSGAHADVMLDRGGVAIVRAVAGASSYDTYRLEVPPGLARLAVSVAGGGADLDLALKAGSEIASYGEGGDCDFRDFSPEPNPACVLDRPAPGTLFIDVVNLGSAGAEYALRVTSTNTKAKAAQKSSRSPISPSSASSVPQSRVSSMASITEEEADFFDTAGLPEPPQSFRHQLLWDKIRSATTAPLKAEAHASLAAYYGDGGDAERAAKERRKADFWNGVRR